MSKTPLGRALRIVLAVILLMVGVAGLFLPILQGILFIAAGLLLLVEAIPKLAKHLTALEQRYPRMSQALTKLRRLDGSLDVKRFLIVVIAISILGALAIYGMSHLLR